MDLYSLFTIFPNLYSAVGVMLASSCDMNLKCMSWNDLQWINMFNEFNFKKAALFKIALHDKRVKCMQIHIAVL